MLLLGDFNAHEPLWLQSQGPVARGNVVITQLDDLCIINDLNSSTNKPFQIQRPTSPDISLCSPNLALNTSRRTVHALSSDHLPIIIDYKIASPIPKNAPRTYKNYRRADWISFSQDTEETLANFSIDSHPNIDSAVKQLTKIVNKADKKHPQPSVLCSNQADDQATHSVVRTPRLLYWKYSRRGAQR
jgi:hypothetical protein